MGTPIVNLRGPLHVTAVELYRGHHGDAIGRCVRCGQWVPCAVREHAAFVIGAAGDKPDWYDAGLPPPASGDRRPGVPLSGPVAEHSGYAMAGRSKRMDAAALLYERER